MGNIQEWISQLKLFGRDSFGNIILTPLHTLITECRPKFPVPAFCCVGCCWHENTTKGTVTGLGSFHVLVKDPSQRISLGNSHEMGFE